VSDSRWGHFKASGRVHLKGVSYQLCK
jgi:hypothetical protein